ncbi:hypothetical protein Tco_0618733 [Tanacetum coccineum]
MRILSVILVKTFEKYGDNYLREIFLRRTDYKEYKISEKDFKNLHPNDFEDLYLLDIQDKLNHLSKSHKIHLHTAVNGGQKLCDGMLTRVMEKLDHMVKDFHLFEYNKGMEMRKCQRMTKGGAKTSSQRSRKDYRSGGSFEVWKALLEEE